MRAHPIASLLLASALATTARAADTAKGVGEPLQPAEAPTGNGEVVERVVAVVNGEALFLSDLRRRAVPFLPQVMEQAEDEMARYEAMKELYGQLLTLMIDETLIQQTAIELKVVVTSDDIDRAIDNVKRQSGLEGDAFWDAVQAQGFTRDRYRSDVRRQLVRLKVVNQKVRSRVNLTEEDVRRRYDETTRRERLNARFHAMHAMVPITESSATGVARARRATEELRASLTAENFETEVASLGGGDLGWVTQGDLPDALEEALLGLEVGEISAPVRTDAGYHLFYLVERAKGGEGMASFDEVRGQIYQQMLETAMAKQEEQFLRELRSQGLVTRRL